MSEPLAVIKHRLLETHHLQQMTRSVELNILKSSRTRLAQVDKDINKLRPRALTDVSTGDKYMALCNERNRLHQVIANAESRI